MKGQLVILSCGFIQALHFQYVVHKNKYSQAKRILNSLVWSH